MYYNIILCVYLIGIEYYTDPTQNSELLSTSTESMQKEQSLKGIFLLL